MALLVVKGRSVMVSLLANHVPWRIAKDMLKTLALQLSHIEEHDLSIAKYVVRVNFNRHTNGEIGDSILNKVNLGKSSPPPSIWKIVLLFCLR